MEEKHEVLVTSDESGQMWNCCIWDYSNGITLKVLKTGASAARTLQLLDGQYFISAEVSKPLVNVWSLLNKGQQEHVKFVCPGKITNMIFTPDAAFCIASIEEKLFIWQVCTGELLSVIKYHYNQIKCVKMTDDGDLIITAAEDNLTCVWKLASLLHSEENQTPLYTWSDSSLPVTDIHVGYGGRRGRAATLYSLSSGDLLLTVVFYTSLTSVVMDAAEFYIFVGGSEGSIFTISLIEPPPTVMTHVTSPALANNRFIGHGKRITVLAVSSDGKTLFSGSEDKLVKIWDVSSKQCLRNLTHKGVITNILICPYLRTFTSTSTNQLKHTLFVAPFQHNVVDSDVNKKWKHTVNIVINPISKPSLMEDIVDLAKEILIQKKDSKNELETEVEELHKLTNDLFQKTVTEIMES